MCLWIRNNQEENDKDLKEFLGDRQEIYVYKILYKNPDKDFYRSEYYEFFWDFKKQKVYKIDRPLKPTKEELSYGEDGINWGEIHKGFHVYTDLETAKATCGYYRREIVKFKVLKEDIVAINNNWFFSKKYLKELVCRKLMFVEVLED
jgi:hypothetical protein